MTETEETAEAHPPQYDPKLVGPVVARAELVDIRLVELHFDSVGENEATLMKAATVGAPGLGISVEWEFDNDASDEADEYSVACRFQVLYDVREADDLSDDNYAQFAHFNAVFQGWQYFRELLDSVHSRARITAPIVPSLPIPRIPEEDTRG